MKCISLFLLALSFLFTSCHYHLVGSDVSSRLPLRIEITPPLSDPRGELKSALAKAILRSPYFSYVKEGEHKLLIELLDDDTESVGYRYDEKKESSKRADRLIANEKRRTLTLKWSFYHKNRKEMGPFKVTASLDYDFANPTIRSDLFMPDEKTTLEFSLGQLAAEEDMHEELFSPLAVKAAENVIRDLMRRYR